MKPNHSSSRPRDKSQSKQCSIDALLQIQLTLSLLHGNRLMTNSKYLQGDFSRIFVCHFGQDDIAAKVDQG